MHLADGCLLPTVPSAALATARASTPHSRIGRAANWPTDPALAPAAAAEILATPVAALTPPTAVSVAPRCGPDPPRCHPGRPCTGLQWFWPPSPRPRRSYSCPRSGKSQPRRGPCRPRRGSGHLCRGPGRPWCGHIRPRRGNTRPRCGYTRPRPRPPMPIRTSPSLPADHCSFRFRPWLSQSMTTIADSLALVCSSGLRSCLIHTPLTWSIADLGCNCSNSWLITLEIAPAARTTTHSSSPARCNPVQSAESGGALATQIQTPRACFQNNYVKNPRARSSYRVNFFASWLLSCIHAVRYSWKSDSFSRIF